MPVFQDVTILFSDSLDGKVLIRKCFMRYSNFKLAALDGSTATVLSVDINAVNICKCFNQGLGNIYI